MERRWKVLAVVSIALFMANLDLFIVNIAFPDIAKDFHGSDEASLSWVLNAYTIVFAALLVPAGRLADRYGRKLGFVAGGMVFLVGSALCGVAPSLGVLIAARALQAVGAAFLIPTSLALLLPEFPPHRRGVAIGVWGAVGGVAAAFGPPLGGVLVEASWRLVFLVNLPVGIAALAFAVRLLREQRGDARGPIPDVLGTALLAAGIGALALGLVEASDWGWGSVATLGCLAGAVVAVGWFWARCQRHPAPVVDPVVVRVRPFAWASVSMLAFMVAFGAMLLGLSLYLTSVWHDSILVAGLSIAPGPTVAAALAVPSGQLARRVGGRALPVAGALVFTLGCAWWAWRMGTGRDFAGALLPGMILTGVGVGMTLAPLSSAAISSLPPAHLATGSGVFTMARQLGAVLGVALLIAVTGTPPHWQRGFDLMVVAGLAASLAASRMGRIVHPVAQADEADELVAELDARVHAAAA